SLQVFNTPKGIPKGWKGPIHFGEMGQSFYRPLRTFPKTKVSILRPIYTCFTPKFFFYMEKITRPTDRALRKEKRHFFPILTLFRSLIPGMKWFILSGMLYIPWSWIT